MKNKKYHILIYGDSGETLRSYEMPAWRLRGIKAIMVLYILFLAGLLVYVGRHAGDLRHFRQNRAYYDSLVVIDNRVDSLVEKISTVNRYAEYIRMAALAKGDTLIPPLEDFYEGREDRDMLQDAQEMNDYEYIPGLAPVKGALSRAFSSEHPAIDISASRGELIRAAASGEVHHKFYDEYLGNVIEISHRNGYITRYAHCESILANSGSTVKKGEPIAIVGNTGKGSRGPHLHFAILRDEVPIDPEKMIF
ncbi:MAG: M23 family metallopeptidase [Fibrobacterota bacterium]